MAAGVPTVAVAGAAEVAGRPGLSRCTTPADLTVDHLRAINRGQVLDLRH